MSHASVGTEPVLADPGTPPSDMSARSASSSRDTGPRAIALVVGLLLGTFIGTFLGIRIGNGIRKRMDHWSPRY